MHGAPTQPATGDAETVVEASNQYTVHETVTVGEGNVVEQTVHSNSNEQVVHSPMGWGGVQEAPTQPATGDTETVVKANNQCTVQETETVGNGNVVEQIVHSPVGWGGMKEAPTQPAVGDTDTVIDDIKSGPGSQVEYSPMGWGSMQETPTQPATGHVDDEIISSKLIIGTRAEPNLLFSPAVVVFI